MGQWLDIQQSDGRARLTLAGSWRLAQINQIESEASGLQLDRSSGKWVLDGSKLEELDTAGAAVALRLVGFNKDISEKIETENFSPEHLSILELTTQSLAEPAALHEEDPFGLVSGLGRDTVNLKTSIEEMLNFFGHAFVEGGQALLRPKQFRFREFCVQLEACGYQAIPIVMLVTFLIGVVIAYLSGIQIERYGANIFIVDGVSLAVCRELSPILVAIIVAGRSGSAFTAQLGTMKLNEEVDAMATMGLSPMRVLVLPRIFALIVAMPLLVFVGDVAGIAGGMLVADFRLGVTGATFIERLHAVLLPKSIIVGLVKAPVFAFFIAGIGCRLGLAVENNARSVGTNTTRTVVQSIVMVILLNAAFAVIFSELRI